MDTKAKAALSIAAILVFFLATWMYTLTHTKLIIANGAAQRLDEVSVSYSSQIVWSGAMPPGDIQLSSFAAKAFDGFHVRVRMAGKTRCGVLGYQFPYNGDLVVLTINRTGDVLYSVQPASSFTMRLMSGLAYATLFQLFGEGTSFIVPEPSNCEE